MAGVVWGANRISDLYGSGTSFGASLGEMLAGGIDLVWLGNKNSNPAGIEFSFGAGIGSPLNVHGLKTYTEPIFEKNIPDAIKSAQDKKRRSNFQKYIKVISPYLTTAMRKTIGIDYNVYMKYASIIEPRIPSIILSILYS